MKKIVHGLAALLALCLLAGCGGQRETAQTTQTAATTAPPVSSQPTTVPTTAPAPEHSDLYIPGVSVEAVILEEIYNGLGPMNDTTLRTDSIIFGGYSTPQSLTAMDELILKLLYHPQMQCGMDAAACEAVIRQLYY